MIVKDINNRDSLEIFERFEIDRNLPKHKKDVSTSPQYTIISGLGITSSTSNFTNGTSFIVNSSGFSGESQVTRFGSTAPLKTENLFQKVLNFFSRKKNVKSVFTQVFENLDQIKTFKEREDYINETISVAENNGQTALVEKIKAIRTALLLESQLISLDFIKVISEEQLIKFAYDCEKGLRLDWLKNFTRNIPKDIIEKKVRADSLKLFDNYAILHFDPDNKSNSLTNSEIEKKKDPILFGVFKESRKLYYVADWKDELCNLTFDQLIDKIGKDNLELKKEIV